MTRRGQYAKGAAKREEILAVALDVVAEHGCRKASNREIAVRVGLTQPGLMHYFGSREELFIEVLRARDQRDLQEFFADGPSIEGFMALIQHNTAVPGLVQLYIEFSAEASIGKHPAHGYFVERYAWVRKHVAQAVRREQAVGLFGDHYDVTAAADVLISAADGLQQQWLLDNSIDMVGHLRELWSALALMSRAPVAAS